MLTAIIIDDEIQSINYLKGLLSDTFNDVQIVAQTQSAKEGVELIESLKPDVVFLDIQLQTTTGFELLSQLRNRNFALIFTTAYEQYALKAIKFAAIDYLLKPIDKIELIEAINKVKNNRDESKMQKSISVFLDNIDKTKRQKLAISTTNSIIVVIITDILYCEADGPYTYFYIKGGNERVISSRHLKEYEELLAEHNFFRVHKSYLINIKEVKQYLKSDGGRVLLSNGAKLEVSDKRKEDLMKILSNEIHFLK